MKIIVVAPSLATFVQKDLDYLETIADTRKLIMSTTKGVRLLGSLFRQIWDLIKYIRGVKYYFIWFADYHSLFPVLVAFFLGRKSIIVLGGTDVNCLPDLGYGYCSNIFRRLATVISLKLSDQLLPVDQSLKVTLEKRHPTLANKIRTVPTGFDGDLWYCDTEKENLILTVAVFANLQRIKIKGIDFFVEVARLLPEYNFMIVGAKLQAEKLLQCPENVVVITQTLTQQELRQLFSRAKIYAQFSLTEGLPSTVCESMLCECIPVGTDVGGMRTAVGDFGTVMSERDPEIAAESIRSIMTGDEFEGSLARKYILEQFSAERRQSSLVDILGIS